MGDGDERVRGRGEGGEGGGVVEEEDGAWEGGEDGGEGEEVVAVGATDVDEEGVGGGAGVGDEVFVEGVGGEPG